MKYDLTNMILWQELKEEACLKPCYVNSIEPEYKLKIGNALYINKKAIRHPLHRLEAEYCTDLKKLYPLSELIKEHYIDEVDARKIKESESHIMLFNVSMFIIPEELIFDKHVIINALDNNDSLDDYDMVVKISKTFSMGSYSL